MAKSKAAVSVREFAPGDEAAFRELNEAWITRYFAIEPKDEAIFADPQGTLLDGGGRIFFAVANDQTVGCCALAALLEPGEFEVVKMAVADAHQGLGIGKQLLETVIKEARASGGTRLYIETNQQLTTAIRLYQAAGFRHIPAERLTPSPYRRANVFLELLLNGDSGDA